MQSLVQATNNARLLFPVTFRIPYICTYLWPLVNNRVWHLYKHDFYNKYFATLWLISFSGL